MAPLSIRSPRRGYKGEQATSSPPIQFKPTRRAQLNIRREACPLLPASEDLPRRHPLFQPQAVQRVSTPTEVDPEKTGRRDGHTLLAAYFLVV